MPLTPLVLALAALPQDAEQLHFTYQWHMEQPIYRPDQQNGSPDRYERAWQSILRTDGGAPHPANDLRTIFGKADRVAAYQWRIKDSIASISGWPEAGAQVSYSGGLIENLQSIGGANQLGYSPGWNNDYRTARGWATNGQGVPRCEMVQFSFHHALLPLLDDSTVRMELALYQAVYDETWGANPAMSRGFFPSEMAFSTRLIPLLQEAGVEWCFVSGEKLSRACADFPVVYGSGGINCDPPNLADQLNPAQGFYYRESISRGCGPAEAAPLAYLPHRAGYVDPESGALSQITVVPCAQGIGWRDGYNPIDLSAFQTLQAHAPGDRPLLVVLAHDGDNAWGGGYDYYQNAVPNFVGQAQSAGYHATVVEEYLRDHPVPAGDFVHVEDGAWVNADGDFGAPQFLNWNWPPVGPNGQVDIANGWAEDIRNWAVIVSAQNAVDTAKQVLEDAGGSVNVERVLYPSGNANAAERAWHYFLGALNSGYMYYGTSLDMEVKPTIACNEALQHANTLLSGGTDRTPPTVWIPQRWPWNPGAVNFGPAHGYQQAVNDGDFWIWTFVNDVSGVTSVSLKWREDLDGQNPLADHANETYAGGAGVGAWQTLPMSGRPFPAGNVYGDPNINFFEMPTAIADQWRVELTGVREKLIDYYVEAVDGAGNLRRSPIQHVWIGDGSGSGGGGSAVTLLPDPPQAGAALEISYDPAGRPLAGAASVRLHWGVNGWAWVNPSDPVMSWNAATSTWQTVITVPSAATQLDFVFTDGAGTWDNNGGADWHFQVVSGGPSRFWVMDGQLDADAFLLGEAGGASLWAGMKGDVLYLATEPAGAGFDRFLLVGDPAGPGAPIGAPWGKAGTVAAWRAYLAQEADNGWSGWFDETGASQSASGTVLEATLDLSQEYGSLPATLHLALALYATPDAGALDPTRQVPPSQNQDGNVDADEYQLVDLVKLSRLTWGSHHK